MLQKGKIIVFLCSTLIVLYTVAAVFYPKVIAQGNEAYPALNVFMDALRNVNEYYVESPDMKKVQEGAMRGLIEALDPYSTYLTKEKVQALESRKEGNASVGVVLSKRANIIYVVSTLRNGPAETAGMRVGDYLTSIDGINVEDASLIEAESLLRGAPGTKVSTSVFRGAQTKPIEIEMTRTQAQPVPVTSKMLDGQIGHLEIASLAQATLDQARLKLKTLISAGAQKLILDLRDCADGEPASGADLANFFMKSGTIYISKARDGSVIHEAKANPDKHLTDLPLAVLINGATAGPAEIAAGALKAGGRATVIGEKSYGMGAEQKKIPLKSGAVLILSIAKYFTPDGKMIEDDEKIRETGIRPAVEAPDRDRMQDLLVNSYFDAQDDTAKYRQLMDKIDLEQLAKAIEVLTKTGAPAKRSE
jgi:carboxyl-terminal processing protease